MKNLNIHISAASGVPYYRQIFDQLEGQIQSGQLAPGAALPSVRELAKQTLVSLITIRRAYRDLADAGLIVQQQGRGTFVAEGSNALSREKSQSDARQALKQAVSQSIQVGLEREDILKTVEGVFKDLIGESGEES